jgi:hypothetical protein
MVSTTSDFKKIKAKVGKRAPIKANVTDTSFKSVGLHISKQVGITTTTTNDQQPSKATITASSTTTRSGLSLHQVFVQFKHPTIAVRISALKSFKNLLIFNIKKGNTNTVTTEQHQPQHQQQQQQLLLSSLKQHLISIQPYISEIITSLLPICCIDDEASVRKLAIQILYEFIYQWYYYHHHYHHHHHSSTPHQQSSSTSISSSFLVVVPTPSILLQPFASYMIAIITTALNSLDIQQRLDGTILVKWLMETIIDIKNNSNNVIHHAIVQFIPPLTRLLAVVPNTSTIRINASLSGSNCQINLSSQQNELTTTTTTDHDYMTLSSVSNNNNNNNNNNNMNPHPMMIVGTMKKSKKNHKKRKRIQEQNHVSSSVFVSNNRNNNQELSSTQTIQHDSTTQSNNNSNNPKLIVLLAIYTLFRTISIQSDPNNNIVETMVKTTTNEKNSDNCRLRGNASMIVSSKQVHRASILFVKNQLKYSSKVNRTITTTTPFYTFMDFPSLQQLQIHPTSTISSSNDEKHQQNTNSPRVTMNRINTNLLSKLSSTDIIDLLSKVREYSIEASQSNDYSSLLYCIVTIRHVLEYYNNFIHFHNNSNNNTTSNCTDERIIIKRLFKICTQIGSCIIETFRMYNEHSSSMAELCRTLLCFVITIQQSLLKIKDEEQINHKQNKNVQQQHQYDTSIKSWIQFVALHIQSNLEDDEATLITLHKQDKFDQSNNANDPENNTMSPIQTRTTTKETLMILSELLTRDDIQHHFTLRFRLIELFGTIFFNIHHPLPNRIICSDVGRGAIILCCNLIAIQQFCIKRMNDFFGITTTTNILQCISYYIVQYQANYIDETAICLTTLQQIVIRMDRSNTIDNNNCYHHEFLPTLRVHIESILIVSEKNNCSIFELYPEAVQRHLVCFCIISDICTKATIQLLAVICARCFNPKIRHQCDTISIPMAIFIIQSIHDIRKTLPMATYVGFLVDSIGIIKLEPIGMDDVVELTLTMGHGIRTVSSCLVHCGTKKILPMLEPLLTVLLDQFINDPISIISIVQTRTALSLIAMFSLDLRRSNHIDNGNDSIFHCSSSEFKALVVDSIVCMISKGIVQVYSLLSMNHWMSPIIALFTSEKDLIPHVLEGTFVSIQEFDSVVQEQILDVWLYIIKQPRITLLLQVEGRTLLARLDNFNKSSNDNDRSNLVWQRLNIEFEIRCGRQLVDTNPTFAATKKT